MEDDTVGKVDDVELVLEGDTGRLPVTALLNGQQVLGERLRGRVGQLLAGTARRMHPAQNPPPLRIEMRHVTEIGSAITLNIPREGYAHHRWNSGSATTSSTRSPEPAMRASDLIGQPAHRSDGTVLGEIAEVLALVEPDGTYTVYAVLVSERNRIRLFGYERPETTGPLPITRLAKALQGPLRENMHRRNRYSSKRRAGKYRFKSLTVQVPRP